MCLCQIWYKSNFFIDTNYYFVKKSVDDIFFVNKIGYLYF